jgi:hypothetical protein
MEIMEVIRYLALSHRLVAGVEVRQNQQGLDRTVVLGVVPLK